MSGYRQSSYDPNAYEPWGRPMRPYNAVQWVGVAIVVLGIVLFLAMIAGDLGVASFHRFRDAPAVIPILVGNLLIYSRRHPATDPAPELAPARKRWFTIIVLVCAIVIGGAALIEYTGAN